MRWIAYIVAALAVLVVLMALVGAMLPKSHTVSRTVQVAMPPAALYGLLSDVSQYQSWRTDLTSLQRLPDKGGLPAWVEETGRMKVPMRFEKMEAPSRLVARIDSTTLPFGGTWTYRISPSAAGSELTITEDGEVSNVFFRVMSRFVFGHYATMDAFLANLQKRETGKK